MLEALPWKGYITIMFRGLAQVLKERLPVSLYTDSESGRRYVIMEAGEYQRLTGALLDDLPQLAEVAAPRKVIDFPSKISHTGTVAASLSSQLAHIELEDEIRVDDLPL